MTPPTRRWARAAAAEWEAPPPNTGGSGPLVPAT
jgi:hypothetical protein